MVSRDDAQVVARIDDLSAEFIHTIKDAQAQLHTQQGLVLTDLESSRVQLHTEYSQQLFDVDGQLQALQRASCVTEHNYCRQRGPITINVGGELFELKHETLRNCRDSFLSDIVLGLCNHEIQKDSQGHVFLDFDPAVFDALLKWLESPEEYLEPPVVSTDEFPHLQVVIDYLGLHQYVAAPGINGWGPRVVNRQHETDSESEDSVHLQAWTEDAVVAPVPTAEADLGLLGAAGSAAGSLVASIQAAGEMLIASEATSINETMSITSEPLNQEQVSSNSALPRRKSYWSHKFSHIAAQIGDGGPGMALISDTRPQGIAAVVRAARGYTIGVHFWEVNIIETSDWSYVGFVSSEWDSPSVPVGRALCSWGVFVRRCRLGLPGCDKAVGYRL